MSGFEHKFTPAEVETLAYNQTAGALHPFTCPNRGDGGHANAYGDLGALVATVRGWICPFCDYTQSWAHGFMSAGKNTFAMTGILATMTPEQQSAILSFEGPDLLGNPESEDIK